MAESGKKSPDDRCALHVRVDPKVRRQFKSLAYEHGETLEGRIERLMKEDIIKSKRRTAAIATA